MAVPTQCRCMEHTAFFPVGRGADYAGEVLSGGECREVVEMINCLYKIFRVINQSWIFTI